MSHFTTVETRIHDLVALEKALEDMGYEFTRAEEGQKVVVRGYEGDITQEEMCIRASRTYDIGVRVTEQGVQFIADWWGVETTRGVSEADFIQQVTKRYAYHKVKGELADRGYTVTEEEESETGEIHIKVRGWK